jgi:hypothetical protein
LNRKQSGIFPWRPLEVAAAAPRADAVTPGEGVVRPWPQGRIRASLRSGDALTQAIQGNVRYAASQLTVKSAVLKKAAASGKVTLL